MARADGAAPSSCTVQAPHWPMPQPNLVPFRSDDVPQDPEQGHALWHIDGALLPVYDDVVVHLLSLRQPTLVLQPLGIVCRTA